MTRTAVHPRLMLLLVLVCTVGAYAQDAPSTEERLDRMSRLLLDTQHQLEATQQRLQSMQLELQQLRGQQSPAATVAAASSSSQQEEQELLAAQIKQHEQTKVESMSKYPVRIYGLLLANAYSNAGMVDDPDLPSAAIRTYAGTAHGSIGAGFRQSVLGITGTGPSLFGGRSSADISLDFFGGPTYNYYGSTNGSVRLRRADIALAWGRTANPEASRDELHFGVDSPLISPLNPHSFATIAESPLAWSGNLWAWAPQLRYAHILSLSSAHGAPTLELEGGLWDPPAVAVQEDSATRVISAGEFSRRPGFMARASVHHGAQQHAAHLGIGGYGDQQAFAMGQIIQMWAMTADWELPIGNRVSVSGEAYRGVGLGGLGGGAYKDTLTGVDVKTGMERTLGLNSVGGWAQVSTRLFQGVEVNMIYGQDGGYASDFHQLNMKNSAFYLSESARSQMVVGNVIYRPRTYLILSPEYRRIASWRITGPAVTANIYTLSLGYQF